jgi:hypothetical protein
VAVTIALATPPLAVKPPLQFPSNLRFINELKMEILTT